MKFLIRRGRAILADDMGDVVAALPPRLSALCGRLMGVFKLQYPPSRAIPSLSADWVNYISPVQVMNTGACANMCAKSARPRWQIKDNGISPYVHFTDHIADALATKEKMN